MNLRGIFAALSLLRIPNKLLPSSTLGIHDVSPELEVSVWQLGVPAVPPFCSDFVTREAGNRKIPTPERSCRTPNTHSLTVIFWPGERFVSAHRLPPCLQAVRKSGL
jgi:hypothetical protein